jgi:hypothetical protein
MVERLHKRAPRCGSSTVAGRSLPAPDPAIPADLDLSATQAQHLLVSVARAQELLGWSPGDPRARVADSAR